MLAVPAKDLAGTTIKRLFFTTASDNAGKEVGAWFDGVVSAHHKDATWGDTYTVKYVDGDEEEMTREEIIAAVAAEETAADEDNDNATDMPERPRSGKAPVGRYS